MGFDGTAFIDRFNTVWNGHDLDGILAMMTDDVVFEASFGKEKYARLQQVKAAWDPDNLFCHNQNILPA